MNSTQNSTRTSSIERLALLKDEGILKAEEVAALALLDDLLGPGFKDRTCAQFDMRPEACVAHRVGRRPCTVVADSTNASTSSSLCRRQTSEQRCVEKRAAEVEKRASHITSEAEQIPAVSASVPIRRESSQRRPCSSPVRRAPPAIAFDREAPGR